MLEGNMDWLKTSPNYGPLAMLHATDADCVNDDFKTLKIMNTKVFLALLLVLTLVGCATAPLKGNADLLDFLADGTTTKAEVLTTLGQPSGRFENDKILTYRLGFEPNNKGYYVVEREADPRTGWPTWMRAKYSLVLCFDDAGVLRKHSLVEVN
jgi:hypothetical protein